MYKSYSADTYRHILNLPSDYTVHAVLVTGAMQRRDRSQLLREAAAGLGVPVEYEQVQENGFFENVTVLNFKGKRVWFDIVYGGAYLSEFVHVACLLGSSKNILIGSCGGLKVGANAGDLVLPTASYGDESSTRLYHPEDNTHIFRADPNLTNVLQARLASDYHILNGPLVTCQAMLAETWQDIVAWSEAGYMGVEMESATLFAVSNYFKFPSAALIFIADNLIENRTNLDESTRQIKPREIRLQLFQAAFREIIAS